MSIIVTRIKEYLDKLGVKPSIAEINIGVANGTLSKPFNKNTSIKTDTLEKFLFFYTKINPIWLFTGSGEMENMEVITSVIEIENKTITTQNKLIMMQEKEIARLEKDIAELKHTQKESVSYRNVAEPAPQLIKKK